MDYHTVIEQAVILLRTFAPKLEDAMATTVVEAGFEQAKRLYEAIKHRFKQEDDKGKALKVLENFQNSPEEYQVNLYNKLTDILQKDPALAQTVTQLLQQGPVQRILANDESQVIANAMHNSLGKGIQDIEAHGKAHVEGNTFTIS